jgi:hypothetical protein
MKMAAQRRLGLATAIQYAFFAAQATPSTLR